MKLNKNVWSAHWFSLYISQPFAVFVLFASVAIFFPTSVFAATLHLKENAPDFIAQTQRSYGSMIASAALLHNYDPKLILAVIVVESDGNAKALSRRGAAGLMQLMPRTARAMGAKDPKEPFQNILAGTKYLRELEDNYGFDSPQEALVAYNMGPTRAKHWLTHASPEEYGYVADVMYVYRLIDEQEADADVPVPAVNTVKNIALEEATSFQPIFTRPRSLSMAAFPMAVSYGRKNEVESAN